MAMKESVSSKEIENLKWQYLKLSELYKEYCEFQKEKAANSNLILPDKFHPATGPVQDINPIVMLFLKYGDIHTKSFDYWYVEYYGVDGYKGSSSSKVDDLSDGLPKKHYMYFVFRYIIDRFERAYNREPTLLEMADCLLHVMREEREFQSYLKIRQIDFTSKEVNRLTKEVKKILMDKIPTNHFYKDQLERYLRVYIMRKSDPRISYRDIHKKEFPKDKDFTDNHKRARINDFDNAKKIINNIENNMNIWW